MTDQLHRILPTVQKPARYVGGEYGQIIKDKAKVDLRVAFCFPDTYEIGMSNIGMRILYGIMNNMDGVWCERVFAPWGDMEAAMRQHQIPLYALESRDPVKDFDLIAFSIGYEMSYTNILNMLNLAGVPLLSRDRPGLQGLVFAGGVCAVNPEPLADFIDFFSLGEDTRSRVEILNLYRKAKGEGWDKPRFLHEVVKIPGVYVPSLYRHHYGADGRLESIEPLDGAPERVVKRIVRDLDKAYYPAQTIVPNTEIVTTGQTWRFSAAAFEAAGSARRASATGLCGSAAPRRSIIRRWRRWRPRETTRSPFQASPPPITVSSRRWPTACFPIARAATSISPCPPFGRTISPESSWPRCSGYARAALTFAPEAGSQRLRDAINKNVTEEEVLTTCATAFLRRLEQREALLHAGASHGDRRGRHRHRGAGVEDPQGLEGERRQQKAGTFHQPLHGFFCAQALHALPVGSTDHAGGVYAPGASFKGAPPQPGGGLSLPRLGSQLLEAVLARGDRRLCPVLSYAVEHGARLDGWDEYFPL